MSGVCVGASVGSIVGSWLSERVGVAVSDAVLVNSWAGVFVATMPGASVTGEQAAARIRMVAMSEGESSNRGVYFIGSWSDGAWLCEWVWASGSIRAYGWVSGWVG